MPLLGVLRVVMVLDLLSLMGTYAAGKFHVMLTVVYFLLSHDPARRYRVLWRGLARLVVAAVLAKGV